MTVNAFDLATGGRARVVQFRDPQIEMAHGAGGKATRRLIDRLMAPLLLANRGRTARRCRARGSRPAQHIAMTADTFVVRPLTFPGGSIGTLAVNGTVNDLAVSAPFRRRCSSRFVLEAGLPGPVLEAEVRAIAEAARRAGVDDRRRRHESRRARQGRRHVHHDRGHRCPRSARATVGRSGAARRPHSAVGTDRRSRHARCCWRAGRSTFEAASVPTRGRSGRSWIVCSRRQERACDGCAIPREAASRPR